MTLALSKPPLFPIVPARFADLPIQRVARGSSYRRTLPPSQMFLVRKGLAAFMTSHPGLSTFDASQGDGGASLGGIPPQELSDALLRFLPNKQATAYGTPQGDARVRQVIFQNLYQLEGTGLSPQHIVLCDGGRDALQKWYQAIHLTTGTMGQALLVSSSPWLSYGHGAYLSGLNLLCAPANGNDFKMTPEGVVEAVALAHAAACRVEAMIITTPDNPTGSFYSEEEIVALIQEATRQGIGFILVDLMYQMVLDPGIKRYVLRKIHSALCPQSQKRVTYMDGLTKSAGASNVRHAHLVCGDRAFAEHLIAIASHTVLPNVLGEAAAHEVYGCDRPDDHPWVCRVVEPTAHSRALFRSRMTSLGYRFVADQGYYAFVRVGAWLGGDISFCDQFHDAIGRHITHMETTADLACYLTHRHGLAVVPGDLFFQPEFIRFSLANAPEVTAGAIDRLDHALSQLA